MRTTVQERLEAYDAARARLVMYGDLQTPQAVEQLILRQSLPVTLSQALGAVPRFQQTRLELEALGADARQRKEAAERVLARLREEPTIPGTVAYDAAQRTAHQAERALLEAAEELMAVEARLEKPLDLEIVKSGLIRVFERGFTLLAQREAASLAEPMDKVRDGARSIVGRLQTLAQTIQEGERVIGRRLRVPGISLPVEALEQLAVAKSPALESPPEPLSDSPPRAPARGLKAVFTGRS